MKKILIGGLLALSLVTLPGNALATPFSNYMDNIIKNATRESQGNTQTDPSGSINLPPSTSCFTFPTSFRMGSNDQANVFLRADLVKEGLLSNSTASDDEVIAAVKAFQSKYSIDQTGNVGPITRAKLNSLYGCTSQSSTTSSSPSRPSSSASSDCYTFDRSFVIGDNTDSQNLTKAYVKGGFLKKEEEALTYDDLISATKQFQDRNGITQTGTVGPLTRAKLNELYGCGTSSSNGTISSSSVYVNELSAKLGRAITNQNGIYAYPTLFTYTLHAADKTVYVSSNPSKAADLSFRGPVTGSLTDTLVSPGTLAGDTSSYYVIPAGESRKFTFSGMIKNAGASGDGVVSISNIYYGTDPSYLKSFFIADGLSNLRLTASFNEGIALQTVAKSCYTFNSSSFNIGSRGEKVTHLIDFLSQEGLVNTQGILSDDDISSAVKAFQSKYGIDQTGNVGPLTRVKLNELYGCASQVPYISNVAGMAADNFEVDAGGKAIIQGSNLSGVMVYIGGFNVAVTQPGDTYMYISIPRDLIPQKTYDLYVYNKKGKSNVVQVKVVSAVINDSPRPTPTAIPNPSIFILSPNGGEVITPSASSPTMLIRWNNVVGFSADNSVVTINLCEVGAQTTKCPASGSSNVVSGLKNTGEYTAALYNASNGSASPGGRYIVKVIATRSDGAIASGASNSYFTITSAQSVSNPSTPTYTTALPVFISALYPSSGPAGSSVTVVGTGFTSDLAMYINGKAYTGSVGINYISPTRLSVVLPQDLNAGISYNLYLVGKASQSNNAVYTVTSVYPPTVLTPSYSPSPSYSPAPTVTLSASQTSIISDGKPGTVTLSWYSTNATSCGFEKQVLPTSGSITVFVASTGSYNISCTGPGGSSISNLVKITFTLTGQTFSSPSASPSSSGSPVSLAPAGHTASVFTAIGDFFDSIFSR